MKSAKSNSATLTKNQTLTPHHRAGDSGRETKLTSIDETGRLGSIQESKVDKNNYFSRVTNWIPDPISSLYFNDDQPSLFDERNPDSSDRSDERDPRERVSDRALSGRTDAMTESDRTEDSAYRQENNIAAADLSKRMSKRTKSDSGKHEKVEYARNDPRWQKSTAIIGTAALATRKVKGYMASFILMSIFLNSYGRNSSTKEQIRALVDEDQQQILGKLANIDPFEQFGPYVEQMRQNENSLFANLTKTELKREECEAKLVSALHGQLQNWEQDYKDLKNKTLDTLETQDKVIEEMTENVDVTLTETVSNLEVMKNDITEGRSAIEDAKRALLAQYTLEYEAAMNNVEAAEETLNGIKEQVDSAKSRVDTTRDNLNKHNKGLRGMIIGEATSAVNDVYSTLENIGQTDFDFQTLGTPEEYQKKLDEEFQPTLDLLDALEKTACVIIETSEDGIVTHDTLVEAHEQSSAELKEFIEDQDVRYNMLKQSSSILELIEVKHNATLDYLNNTANNTLDLNETISDVNDIKDEVTDGVNDAFTTAVYSEEAERKFDTFDSFRDASLEALKWAKIAGLAYFVLSVGRRGMDEARDRPNSSLGKIGNILNQRFQLQDDMGVEVATTQGGIASDTKVRSMRCERFCSILKNVVLGQNKLFNAVLLLWIAKVARDAYLAPAFADVTQKTVDRFEGIDAALLEAQKNYHASMKRTCVDSFQQKFTVAGLNGARADAIREAYRDNPKIEQAVDFLRENQDDEECLDPTLNEALENRDKTKAEIDEVCDDLATNHVDNFFKKNLNHEESKERFNQLTETLEGENSEFKAKQNFENWSMAVLLGFSVLSDIIITAFRWKDPDQAELHGMDPKNRGLFAKWKNREVPAALAKMNQTLHFLGLEIDGAPLLKMDPERNLVAGFNPNNSGDGQVYHDSMNKQGWSNWLPWKDSLSKADKVKIEIIKNEVQAQLEDYGFIVEGDPEDILNIVVVNHQTFSEKTSKRSWYEGFKERMNEISSLIKPQSDEEQPRIGSERSEKRDTDPTPMHTDVEVVAHSRKESSKQRSKTHSQADIESGASDYRVRLHQEDHIEMVKSSRAGAKKAIVDGAYALVGQAKSKRSTYDVEVDREPPPV